MPSVAHAPYRERLWPTPWMFIVTLLLIPASILVLAPVNLGAGIVTGVLLYLGIGGLLILASPVIEVTDEEFRAGKGRLPLAFAGEATGHAGRAAVAERGTRLDARAWLVIRGWIKDVVKVPVTDEDDPAPYWLVSTRHPTELAAAINGSRR